MAEAIQNIVTRYAAGYAAHAVKTGKTYDIPAATRFAVLDLMNMHKQAIKSGGQQYAEDLIRDEVAYWEEKWAK